MVTVANFRAHIRISRQILLYRHNRHRFYKSKIGEDNHFLKQCKDIRMHVLSLDFLETLKIEGIGIDSGCYKFQDVIQNRYIYIYIYMHTVQL